MRNSSEWYSISEILEKNFDLLPSSDKGISKKAERENWKKRQREGVKGKTFEYHYSSFPVEIQKQLGFEPTEENSGSISTEEALKQRLAKIDKIVAEVNSLNEKVKALEEPTLESLPNTLDNAEKRLIRWFRQCNKDRQAMLLSSAEVFADMSLAEQKESSTPLENYKVA